MSNKHKIMTTFVRNPIYVQAVRVTAENMEAVAALSGGTIINPAATGVQSGESVRTRPHIKIDVPNPKYARQTTAFIGDWVVESLPGKFRIYTNTAFHSTYNESVMDYEALRQSLSEKNVSATGAPKKRTRQPAINSSPSETVSKAFADVGEAFRAGMASVAAARELVGPIEVPNELIWPLDNAIHIREDFHDKLPPE